MSLNLTYWNLHQEPAHATLDQVMDNLRNDDMREGLMYEPCTMDDVLDETQPAESLIMDAIISQYSRLKARMNAMQRVMSRTGLTTKGKDEDGKEIDVPYTVIGYQLSDPFMRLGTANVVALFELSDGQTVSIYFHNPDTTPKKIAPTDEVISFKWLLNKKDITIVVAPERGKDIDLHQVALRIMKIAHKNSEAFARQNKNRQERVAKVTALRERVAQKEKLLAQKVKKIDELKYLKAQEEVDQILEEDRLMKGKLTAALYQELKEKNRLTDRQDELDDLFNERIAAIRDALRQKGWNGERYKGLNKEGIYLKTEWETTKDTGNTLGMSYHIPEVDFHYVDDLSDNPEDIAQKIDDSIQSLLAKLLNEQKAKLETNTGKVEQYLKDQGYAYNSSDWTFDKVLDDREIAISVNDRVVDIVVDAKKVGAASYKVIDERYRFEDTALDVILGKIKDAETQDLTQLYDEQSAKAKALNDAQIAAMGLGDKKENAPQEDQPVVITGKEFGEFDTSTPEGKKALREKAFEHIQALVDNNESVYCADLDANVSFTKSANRKYKSASKGPLGGIKSQLAFKIKELIAKGKQYKEKSESYNHDEQRSQIKYHYLKTNAVVGEQEFTVKLVIRETPEKTFHYDLQLEEGLDQIMDSVDVQMATMPFLRLSQAGGDCSHSVAQSELQLDDTLTLDDVSSGYVLNLFVFDKDGNEIKDEDIDQSIEGDNNKEIIFSRRTSSGSLLELINENRVLKFYLDGKRIEQKSMVDIVTIANMKNDKFYQKILPKLESLGLGGMWNNQIGLTREEIKLYLEAKEQNRTDLVNKMANSISITLSSRGMGDFTPVVWIGDIDTPNTQILIESKALLETGHDVDNRNQSDEEILNLIRNAKKSFYNKKEQNRKDLAWADNIIKNASPAVITAYKQCLGIPDNLPDGIDHPLYWSVKEYSEALSISNIELENNLNKEVNDEFNKEQGMQPEEKTQLDKDRQFLQDVIDGKVDVFASDFNERLIKVSSALQETQTELVNQAANVYAAKMADKAKQALGAM